MVSAYVDKLTYGAAKLGGALGFELGYANKSANYVMISIVEADPGAARASPMEPISAAVALASAISRSHSHTVAPPSAGARQSPGRCPVGIGRPDGAPAAHEVRGDCAAGAVASAGVAPPVTRSNSSGRIHLAVVGAAIRRLLPMPPVPLGYDSDANPQAAHNRVAKRPMNEASWPRIVKDLYFHYRRLLKLPVNLGRRERSETLLQKSWVP
jgi:hypothetical protein